MDDQNKIAVFGTGLNVVDDGSVVRAALFKDIELSEIYTEWTPSKSYVEGFRSMAQDFQSCISSILTNFKIN